MQATTVEGQIIRVGDYVSFKSDIEQYGQVIEIRLGILGGVDLVLENTNGFTGEYIGGATRTTQRAVDCWLD
ncbi:MAG: hypothetical protein FJ211_09940 [Ignavibacteria bacterium]|nr:hypothetical protein [Ignavibacteria bacterium]